MTAFSKNLSQLWSTSLFLKHTVSAVVHIVLCKNIVLALFHIVFSIKNLSQLWYTLFFAGKNLLSSGPHHSLQKSCLSQLWSTSFVSKKCLGSGPHDSLLKITFSALVHIIHSNKSVLALVHTVLY